MPEVLVVSPSLSITDPAGKLDRYFSSEFQLYDRLRPRPDNRIGLLDVLASVLANSMLNTAEKVSTIWNDRRGIEEALAAVPRDASLLWDDVPWQALEGLMRAALDVRFVGLGVATKILHRKRPHLIPMIDRVVEGYYESAYPPDVAEPALDDAGRFMRIVRHFQVELKGCEKELERLLRIPRRRRCYVSPVRVLEALIWIEREKSGRFRAPEPEEE